MDLVGYILGTLEVAEREVVEKSLSQQDGEVKQRVASMREAFLRLQANASTTPPEGLAQRTCHKLREDRPQ